MHGGAAGSGAPRGNKNALKNGFYTSESVLGRRLMREMLWESRTLLKRIH
jgi:uncharacterized protein YjcR